MVSVDKIREGVGRYVDKKVLAGYQVTGWKAVVVPAAVAVAINTMINKYANHPVATATGIVNDGMVDIDLLATEVKKRIPNAGMAVHIPVLEADAVFYQADIDDLVTFIKEA